MLRERDGTDASDARRCVGLACERFDDAGGGGLTRNAASHAFARWCTSVTSTVRVRRTHRDFLSAPAAELVAALRRSASELIGSTQSGVDARALRCQAACTTGSPIACCGGPEATAQACCCSTPEGRAPTKRVGLLVDMLRELVQIRQRSYRLVIAGDGPLTGMDGRAGEGGASPAGFIAVAGSRVRRWRHVLCELRRVRLSESVVRPLRDGTARSDGLGRAGRGPANRGGVVEYLRNRSAWLASPDARSFASAVLAARGGDPDSATQAPNHAAHQFRWSRVTNAYSRSTTSLGRVWGSRAPAPTPVPIG